MRTVFVFVLALAGAVSGQQQSGSPVPTTNDNTQEEAAAVLRAQRDYGRASARSDEDALNAIWMPDYSFGNGNGIERSRQQCLDFLKATANVSSKRKDGFSTGHNVSKPNVRVHGDVAVVTGDRVLGKRYSGVKGVVKFHYIEVWLKDEGRWRLLANQLTPATGHGPVGTPSN